jgi:hypothetical protein
MHIKKNNTKGRKYCIDGDHWRADTNTIMKLGVP